MTTKTYSAVLEGVEALDLPMSVLRDLCDLFVEGAQRSARLVAEGRSVARGTAPWWLSAAADIRICSFEAGSLALGVRAPRLVDAAPDVFAQQQLFPPGADPTGTAFDLFLDAADDACSGRRDSERLDAGVLEVLARAGALFAKGGTRLSVARAGRAAIVLDAGAATTIKRIADETPATRVSRVRGMLDTLSFGSKMVVVRLDDGRMLRGVAGSLSFEELKEFLGTQVVVEGAITFRPSGEPLRIEVDSASPAAPGDVIWARLPKVEPMTARPRPSAAVANLDALFGTWPGDESDEELAAALREAS